MTDKNDYLDLYTVLYLIYYDSLPGYRISFGKDSFLCFAICVWFFHRPACPPLLSAPHGTRWHIPQLVRTPDAELVAIVQRSEQPTAAAFLNMTLDTKTALQAKYGVPMFTSCEEMLSDENLVQKTDGVIICTSHACHSWMAKLFLDKGIHVLCEKPMTVDVSEARALADYATALAPATKFFVNHTANFRPQFFEARRLIKEGALGTLNTAFASCTHPCFFCSTTQKTKGG